MKGSSGRSSGLQVGKCWEGREFVFEAYDSGASMSRNGTLASHGHRVTSEVGRDWIHDRIRISQVFERWFVA